MQVYYRPGSHEGHTSNDEGWILIHNDPYVRQKGTSGLTRLGPFLHGRTVDVPAGQSAPFYVYTTETLSYQHNNAHVEGIVVADDGNLMLKAGIALAYGK